MQEWQKLLNSLSKAQSKSLSYWKGRVEDARSALKSNPTSLEYANAVGFAREKTAAIEANMFKGNNNER
jgi:hypothetical protein